MLENVGEEVEREGEETGAAARTEEVEFEWEDWRRGLEDMSRESKDLLTRKRSLETSIPRGRTAKKSKGK